ncbi:hypothetical protein HAX54_036358 [Datura stramonium]|uniref:Uncharacterized protein n=1 Tax=Datura stramonium TaxID=4076 RepID=A0ABS8VI06_DATST|nr:hypothetical protein [Datura stramonium]
MKLFDEQLGTFMDRAIAAALAPYESLYARIGDIKARQKRSTQEFSILVFEDSKKDDPFIDLLGDHPKEADKCPREGDEDEAKSQRKKHKKGNKSEWICTRIRDYLE